MKSHRVCSARYDNNYPLIFLSRGIKSVGADLSRAINPGALVGVNETSSSGGKISTPRDNPRFSSRTRLTGNAISAAISGSPI